MSDDVLKAFANAAGISAFSLSIAIRTGLLVLFLMWAAWVVLELLRDHKKDHLAHVSTLLSQYIQVFFLVSILIALVFVS